MVNINCRFRLVVDRLVLGQRPFIPKLQLSKQVDAMDHALPFKPSLFFCRFPGLSSHLSCICHSVSNSIIMHPIFAIRDYLDQIFFWLSSYELAATICVNKAWFEASIFPLWRTIDLSVALELLRPTSGKVDGFRTFFELITLDNWKRFMTYAQHVRVLCADERDSIPLATAIMLTPPSLKDELKYFFPNCRYVSWHTTNGSVGASILKVLLSPDVDHIVLTGKAINDEWFDRLCQLLVERLVTLSVFHVEDHGSNAPFKCSDSFLGLLVKFSSTLTDIWIPENLFTDTTLARLLECDLRHLKTARSIFMEEPRCLTREYADPKGPKALYSLKSLIFGPSTSQFLALQTFGLFPHRALTKFQWNIRDLTFNVDALVTIIFTVSPNLETLSLGEWGFMNERVISWASVERLLECAKLTCLSLHCARVDMTLDNLVELLRSRQEPSSWHVLQITTTQSLHFQDALLAVAKYCPRIHTLGIRVHDQDFAHLFKEIPELSSRLIRRHSKEKNIRNQIELTNQLRQAGFFLPCLSIIRLNESICGLESVGPLAFLILAVCDVDDLDSCCVPDDEELDFRVNCRINKYQDAVWRLTRRESLFPGSDPMDIYREYQNSSDIIIPETFF